MFHECWEGKKAGFPGSNPLLIQMYGLVLKATWRRWSFGLTVLDCSLKGRLMICSRALLLKYGPLTSSIMTCGNSAYEAPVKTHLSQHLHFNKIHR